MLSKTLKTIIGLLLFPLAIGTAKAFYGQISGIGMFSGILHMLERGVLVYLLFHVIVMRPVYIYVLGHELVHVFATWMCGGHVVSFKVTPSGGNVVTSKTNFFIELSPYFVPIHTIFLGIIFIVLRAIGKGVPYMSDMFVFLIGFTMALHFIMTAEVLKVEQSDILKSGFVFSIILIFLANLLITMAVFSPMFDGVSFKSFLYSSKDYSIETYNYGIDWVVSMINKLRVG